MFKMRSVIIDANAMTAVVPLITRPGSSAQPVDDPTEDRRQDSA
jgi:hypothetical protein